MKEPIVYAHRAKIEKFWTDLFNNTMREHPVPKRLRNDIDYMRQRIIEKNVIKLLELKGYKVEIDYSK